MSFAQALPVSEIPALPEALDGILPPTPETGADTLFDRFQAYVAQAEQTLAAQRTRIEQLEELYETDDLTGLLNRRGFLRALNTTLGEARRHGDAGLVAYMDLDGFKEINDTYGHAAGDHVLAVAGETLKRFLRKTDHVARMGGDEFAMILSRSEVLPARARIVALQEALSRLVIQFEGVELSVGASVGFKVYGPSSTSEAVLRAADKAMYRAKARRKAR